MADYGDPSKIWLHSYDIADVCYFELSRAVGDATRAMVPHLLKQWKLTTGTTALDVPRQNHSPTKSLYFIDANHSHPWPALDLIALLPGLKPGDHVALHDINLPTITEGKFPDYGVQWLFEDWLGEEHRAGCSRAQHRRDYHPRGQGRDSRQSRENPFATMAAPNVDQGRSCPRLRTALGGVPARERVGLSRCGSSFVPRFGPNSTRHAPLIDFFDNLLSCQASFNGISKEKSKL